MKVVATLFNRQFPGWVLPAWCADRVREAFPDVDFVRMESGEGLLDEIRDADVLFSARMTAESFHAAKALAWIHAPMAGLSGVLIPEVVSSDILVSNSRGVHADTMAEHGMALLLALSRRLHDCLDSQRRQAWERTAIFQKQPSFELLKGKTLGVLGFGAIGGALAERARAFGMQVIGIRRRSGQLDARADRVCSHTELPRILGQLDALAITAPLTPETEGMIGAEEIAAMKATAFLVNLSRGPILDQPALVQALTEGRLAGAGLDVFVPEPLPDGHPLYRTPNLILTPHISGTDPGLWERTIGLFIENLRRFRAGEALINEIDKPRGY